MKILYKIQCKVPLHISWNCYAPTNLDEWIRLKISDKVIAKIGLTDLSPFPSGSESTLKVNKTIFSTDSLTIEIEGYWSKEIAELLRSCNRE
jgi:hypothetical protein